MTDRGAGARTVQQWVATATPENLRIVLEHRPDVRIGAPLTSRDDLAERLSHEAGVMRCMARVPAPGWQVLAALGVLGGWATVGELVDVLDGAGVDDVRRWVDELAVRALVVPGGPDPEGEERVVANPTALDVVGDVPGLGPAARGLVEAVNVESLHRVVRRWGLDARKRKADLVEAVVDHLRDPARVRQVLALAPDHVARHLLATASYSVQVAHAVLGAREAPEPDATLTDAAAFRAQVDAQRWATDAGLAFGSGYGYGFDAVMPSEVTVALGGPLRLPFTPRPPVVATAPVASRQVDDAAAAALADLLGGVVAVLENVRGRPAATVAAGGVGARELTRIARTTGESTTLVRFALSIAVMLGLLEAGEKSVVVGEAFETWRRCSPADRALDVWQAWHAMPTHPTVDRDEDGKSLPALGRGTPLRPGTRGSVLAAAAASTGIDLEPDLEATAAPGGRAPQVQGVVDVDALGAALVWADSAGGAGVDLADVRTVWSEATTLGLVALGVVTPTAVDLLREDLDAARARLVAALPSVTSTARLGSDLTAVVAGVPDPEVTDLLDLLADRETRGAASTWRLSPGSVRRAFDAGLGVDDVLTRLAAVAGTVPQSVEYLVRDVGRRHGHVTVRPAACVLVVPDDALRAELLVASTLRSLGLTAVDGTVLAASATPDVVLERLRAAGYLPVRTTAGGVRVTGGGAPGGAQGGAQGADRGVGGSGPRGTGADDDRPRGIAADLRESPRTMGTGAAGAAASQGAAVGGDTDRTGGAPGADAPGAGWASRARTDVEDALRYVVGDALPDADDQVATARAVVDQHARRLIVSERRNLAWAVTHGAPVYLEYRSGTGTLSQRVVSDLTLLGPSLVGWCHLRDAERYFSLDRIEMLAPVA